MDIQLRTKGTSVGIQKCGRGCVDGCVFSETVFLSAAGEPATLKVLGLVSKTIPWKENTTTHSHMLKSERLLSEHSILTKEEITGLHTAPPPSSTTRFPSLCHGLLGFRHLRLFVLLSFSLHFSAGPIPPSLISRYFSLRPQLLLLNPSCTACVVDWTLGAKNGMWLFDAVACGCDLLFFALSLVTREVRV